MFCSKCGMQNTNGERFCKNCGCLLENSNQQVQQFQNQQQFQYNGTNNNMNMGQPVNNQNTTGFQNNGGLDSNYVENAVNPDMKKWAILSVVVPIAAIIWYWFIGLSFYLGIAIAAAGFGFAQKGEMANKKLATAGKVLSGILAGLSIVMLVLQLIALFTR